MLKVKIDTKTIFILVLAAALILTIIFRPTKPIETYENEINMLKEQNKELILSNDSIKSLNLQLEKEIKEILFTIDSTQALLRNTEKKLKKLEERRNEVSNIVDNLNSDGITESLSNYLKRRGQNPR